MSIFQWTYSCPDHVGEIVDVLADFDVLARVLGEQPDRQKEEAHPETEHEDEIQAAQPDGLQDAGGEIAENHAGDERRRRSAKCEDILRVVVLLVIA